MSELSPDKYGALIHKGKLMDAQGWQDTNAQEYVAASDYEALRLRFEKACAEITRLSAPSTTPRSGPTDAAVQMARNVMERVRSSMRSGDNPTEESLAREVLRLHEAYSPSASTASAIARKTALAWCVQHEGECLGDHPAMLARARAELNGEQHAPRLIEALEWALKRIRTSLDQGEHYAKAESILEEAKSSTPAAPAIEQNEIPLCDGHAAAWFTERNHLTGDHRCIVCAFGPAFAASATGEKPLPMVLHCPACGLQHVDAKETHGLAEGEQEPEEPAWNNPPHRSHLCHGCGCIWRPADVPTNGVKAITTRGKADTWPNNSPDGGKQTDG